jgi:hypothetical protein
MSTSELDLARELIHEGGLSVETLDENGNLALRTVFQVDGDVICWISRDCAQKGAASLELAERHWDKVVVCTLATETALLNLQSEAQKWIARMRVIGKASAVSGMAGSMLSYLRALATPAFVLSLTIAAFGFAFWRWGPRLIARYFVRHFKSWV